MTAAEPVRVRATDLLDHASAVQAVASIVRVAADAVECVHFDAHAYGAFCQALPIMMEPLKQLVADANADAGGALLDLSDRLTAAATSYTEADERAAAKFAGES